MKIIKENQDLIVVKDKNVLAFFVGIIFALIGLTVILKPDFFVNEPPIWSGFFGLFLGLFVVFMNKTITVTFDKTVGKAIFEFETLIGFGKKRKEYDISSIRRIELQQFYSRNTNNSNVNRASQYNNISRYEYKLALVLDNNENIFVGQGGAINSRQIANNKEIGIKISNFLNVTFEEMRPPTLNEMLSVAQKVAQEKMETLKE